MSVSGRLVKNDVSKKARYRTLSAAIRNSEMGRFCRFTQLLGKLFEWHVRC
jgi:hypothetical protein